MSVSLSSLILLIIVLLEVFHFFFLIYFYGTIKVDVEIAVHLSEVSFLN
jgi:hypothetical protein